MKKTNQSRMADNYTSMSWGRGDKLYASDLTKMSRQVDSNENELVDLTTTTIPKIVSDVASNKSTLDEFAPKVAKIDVPEGSTIVKEIDKAVADLVNGAPETLDTIKEVADAIEQNGDAIDALNDIVTKNKVAIDSVDAEQKATAEKLATLDSKAVKYQEFGKNRKTIQLANYDTISGVTTNGLGVNLVMVSKWDKADFGSAQIETNLNAKDGIVTINDTETVATVKQVGEAAGQLNTKFEGKLETVNSAIDSLGVRIDNAKEQLNASIESVKSYADEQLATKQPVGDYPEFQKFSAGVDPAERKTIQLANADSISGVTTDGRGVNVAMVSKWNKVDLGSSQVSMNLNSLDGQVTINDGKVVATLDDISGSETATNALIDKKIADYHKESDAKFVSAKTTGRHSTVAVSTADDEVRLSSSETNPTGSQGGVYVGSQLIQVMTNYKPSDRKEASLLMITPSRFDLKRRDAEGQMHEIELVDLITKANKVPGVEAGVEAVKKCVETLSGEVNTKTPLESFEAFKTANTEAITAECAKVRGEFAAADTQLQEQLNVKIDAKLAAADFETFKTETYEPKVAELTNSIGDETSARQDAITETKNAFKAADEKVTGEYTKAIEAAKTEVTTKVTEVEGALNAYKGSNDTAVAKVKTDVTEAFGAADQALETKVTQGYTAAVEGEKAAREAAVALLATKVELEGVNATLTGKFGDYYTKGEVDGKLASIYRFKGSVAAEDQLPKQDQVIGDVYNVEDTGMNVAWDGKKWDKLGSVINLAPYATTEAVEAKITETKQAASEALNQHAQSAETTYAKKAEVTKQIEAVDGKFAGKADKVHTHTIENITGLQDALDGKQAVGDYALKSEVKTVDDKFAGYTTTEALNGLLDGKAAVVHTHTVDNVTGLQAALDAKMAASEAAKFATHDHNHDQAYLAIKGKAESAKVADSVAWANVTGTEAIAVKSEVEAVDAKFASYTTTEALAAEYATKQALADGLKAKAEAAHTHVAADITDLQDKFDAKLDVGGKAESAKVADSVAWTGVTGTEGVALKSDLDSKMEASEASKFAQASHVHAIENVTGLQQALDDKIAVADADGKYALKSAITGLATKEELNGKAAASHTHQEGEVEGLTAKLATFALKSEIAGFVTDEALKRDYTNTTDLGQLLDSKLDTTAGDKKYATKTELNGYQPKGDYVAKTEVNSIVEAAVKAPVFVNIPLRPEPNYTEAAIANWFGCETIEQVGQVITGDKVVYLHFTSTGKDYKIPVQYCAFKADGSNDIILMTVGLDTANDEVCKYKITIALNSDSSTVDVNKTPLVSPAA